MKKNLLALALLLLAAAGGMAANVKCLVVQLTDDTLLYFPLEQTPVVVFNGESMNLKNESYSLSAVARLYVTNIDETVVGIDPQDADAQFSLADNGLLRVKAEQATLYTLGGTQVQLPTVQGNGLTVFNVNGLPKGCYILRTGHTAFKFHKK